MELLGHSIHLALKLHARAVVKGKKSINIENIEGDNAKTSI